MATVYDKMPVPDIRQAAEDNAAAVLDSFWDGKLPVDPIRMARELGVDVFTAQLGSDVYGMITGTPSATSIYLDVDQAPVRMRFTCAHELGHYVERSSRIVNDDSEFAEIDRRSDDGHGKGIEVFANNFAGAVLMPEKEVRRLHGQGKNKLEMARAFNVSLAAMGLRLMRLDLP
jgi:Zn-dependent peptidase ImmA (M78 family)